MKTCIDCNKTMSFASFTPKASCKDGYEPRCKKCRSIKYNKSTPALLCKKLYLSQITNSATRGHPIPAYSLEELTAWVTSQPDFKSMFEAWQISGYQKDLAPSIDRINDAVPYILSNLQLMLWHQNRAKGAKAKKNNTLLVNHRGVIAYHLDGRLYKKYPSMAEAMREFGGKATASFGISSVCNGVPVKDGKGYLYTPRTYKGFIWKWG